MATGVNKAVAALFAGALCTIGTNILGHVDIAALQGWTRWTIEGLRTSDSMAAVQTVVTTILVFLIPHGGTSDV